MLRFTVRRLLQLIPILIGVSILVFIWIRLLPGSPAQALLGERATPASVAQIRHQYGLDQPLYVQYWRYLVETVGHLNLGTSIKTFRPVTEELKLRFPATVELALGAMIFAVSFGIPLGFLAAKRYGSAFDHGSLLASLIGISIPIFFLGLILKYIFSVRLHWLPSIGREDVLAIRSHPTNFYILDAIINGDPEALWDAIKHLILPAIALGLDPTRDHRPDHPRLRPRRPERGLRPHGAGQGSRPARRRLASRAAERDAPDHDHRRTTDGTAAVGRRPDRDGVRVAGGR